MKKMFDLNTEKILEDWGPVEATRELIANALDEQKITESRPIVVKKMGESWIIRDFGRGLKELSLTQNESKEKLSRRELNGKFGFGLKDAFATFYRNDIQIKIKTSEFILELGISPKADFSHIETLHAIITPSSDTTFTGTEITLSGIKDGEISEAKSKFLFFNQEQILDRTHAGEVIAKGAGPAKIYVNGLCVATEDKFAFSYNIVSPPKSITKHLNRERQNVGRSAYTDIVKKIILTSESEEVARTLFNQFSQYQSGKTCDELGWSDIQEHAVKIISSKRRAVFLTHDETVNYTSVVDSAKRDGNDIFYIPNSLAERLSEVRDHNGNSIRTLGTFIKEIDDSFEFDFVDSKKLTKPEREIYNLIPSILKLIGGQTKKIQSIRISNTMKQDYFGGCSTLGLWDETNGSIILHRSTLKNLVLFCGALAHEVVHAKTGFDDVSRDFESALTQLIGFLITKNLARL